MQSPDGNKKINVLFLSAWYPNKYDPMPGLFVRNHAISMENLCNVTVLYLHPDEHLKNSKYAVESNKYGNITEHIVYYKKSSRSLPLFTPIIKIFRFLKAYAKGFKLISQIHGKPDIIHVNILTRTGIPALWLKKTRGIPYIVTEHWSRYLPQRNEFRGFIRKFLTRIIVRDACCITTVTENLKQAMIACGLKHLNYQVIPNVADVSLFKIGYAARHSGKKIISHISCFDEAAKNVKGIVRMAKKLSAMRNDFEIHLIGDGKDKYDVYEYSKSIGVLGRYVFFDGLLTDKQLVNAINQSEFILLFSNYENFPAVIPESLACGKPLLSTNTGGISEHLNTNIGILIPVGNEDALLEKTNYLLDHLSSYHPESIRSYATSHFSNEVVAQQFFKIYQQALNQ